MPVPERIKNAPDLIPGLEFYYEAFCRLTTSRMLGAGGLGPIPYAAIDNYCRAEEIYDPELREDLFYHVEKLDLEYIKWQTAKMERERNAGGS